jgi:hypothetical protein
MPRADSHLSDSALELTLSSLVLTGCVCACTHYLVFKEPTLGFALGNIRPRPCFGEPSEVTRASPTCQHKISTEAESSGLGKSGADDRGQKNRWKPSESSAAPCSRFLAPNVQRVSRTNRGPSSDPDQMVLLCTLSQQQHPAINGTFDVDPKPNIRHAAIVQIHPAGLHEAARFPF